MTARAVEYLAWGVGIGAGCMLVLMLAHYVPVWACR